MIKMITVLLLSVLFVLFEYSMSVLLVWAISHFIALKMSFWRAAFYVYLIIISLEFIIESKIKFISK